MSDTEEHRSLLADMNQDSESDHGQAVAMQQLMGFSSFGGPQKPKRQPRGPGVGRGFGTGANTQPVKPRTPSTTTTVSTAKPTLSASSHPFIPASIAPRPQKQPKLNPSTQSETPKHDTAYFQTALPIQASASPSTQPIAASSAWPHSSLNPTSPPFTNPALSIQTSDASILHPSSPSSLAQNTSTSNSTFPQPQTLGITTTEPQLNLDETAYTNPHTNISLTRRELQAFERGVLQTTTNNDGTTSQVKIYFKPNFIDDDPWAGLY